MNASVPGYKDPTLQVPAKGLSGPSVSKRVGLRSCVLPARPLSTGDVCLHVTLNTSDGLRTSHSVDVSFLHWPYVHASQTAKSQNPGFRLLPPDPTLTTIGDEASACKREE